jgi:putative heme-binding domain-containing protein
LRLLGADKRFADPGHFDFFLTRLAATNKPAVRLTAAELANAQFSADQINQIISKIETDSLIAPSVAESLSRQKSLDSSTKVRLAEIQNRFKTTTEDQEKILADLEPLLTGGDENRGQQLFIGKAGCSACHRVGKHGGLVGPDLTRVGAIRSGRDLVESLALPSATFAQSYEPYRVTLTSDAVLTGVRVRSTDGSFVLRDASGVETRLRQGEIKSTERAAVSIMPDGLLNGLSRDEIRDLLAYLQKLK